MKPTIRSMANDLKLSPATVSKALSGRKEISESTRQRVFAHAKLAGYFKNTANRQRIAVLLSNPDDSTDTAVSFLYDMLIGFRKYAGQLQKEVVIYTLSTEEQEQQTLDEFALAYQIEGLFLMGLKTTDPFYKQLETTKTHVVVLDIDTDNPFVGNLGTDSIFGGKLAIDHLVSLGHRRIGFVNGTNTAYISQERLAGYLAAIFMNGLQYDQSLLFEGDFSAKSGEYAAEFFANTDATAIYFASDLMALGAIKRFRELGIAVPHDISIVGFDNLPICQGSVPTISSIAQNRVQLGETACALLEAMLSGVPINMAKLKPTISVRESTGRRAPSHQK